MQYRQDAMIHAAHDIKSVIQGMTAGIEFAQAALESAGDELAETRDDVRGVVAATKRLLALTLAIPGLALLVCWHWWLLLVHASARKIATTHKEVV
ncbi:MAG TPA: hypothetical protein VNL77_05425 [Roseiflexaceae bacterium]|nr:hypothetical protein [Roseiflexaceae bacterium]